MPPCRAPVPAGASVLRLAETEKAVARHRGRLLPRLLGLAGVAAGIGLVQPAAAELQLLALVATDGPIVLHCERGSCAADFSAFFLQAERRAPEAGEPYHLHRGADVRLVGITDEGRRMTLPAESAISVSVLRTHVAVRLSVPQALATNAGVVRFEIEVDEGAALIPDAGGQSPEAVAQATGPLRRVGARMVDGNAEGMAAARLTQRLINALPNGRETAELRETVWQAAAAPLARGQGEAATGLARQTHDRCRDASAAGLFAGMRNCLESLHDAMLGDLNKRYWDELKAGS